MTDNRPMAETARLTRELSDLRDQVRRLECQILADIRYLDLLLVTGALPDISKERVRQQMEYMAKDWPQLLKEREEL